MAKRFAYVSFGILCLVAAYQLGARDARADWNEGVSGEIIGITTDAGGHEGFVYTATGEAWAIRPNASWARESWVEFYDLPVATSDVKFIEDSRGVIYLITKDDIGWVKNGSDWESAGPFPGGPVPVDVQSWGETKSQFR